MTNFYENDQDSVEQPPSFQLLRNAQTLFHQLPQTITSDPMILDKWVDLSAAYYGKEYTTPELLNESRNILIENPDIIASTLEYVELDPLDLSSEVKGGIKASLISVLKTDTDLEFYEIGIRLFDQAGKELGDPNSSVFVSSEYPAFIELKEASVIDQLISYRRQTYKLKDEGYDVTHRKIGRGRIFMEHIQAQNIVPNFLSETESLAISELIGNTALAVMLALKPGA